MDLSTFRELCLKRQSCRNFDGREVPETLLREVCETALLAPSACNAQPWKLVAVLGEKRREIAKCVQSLGMNKFASDAGAFVVVCEGESNLTARVGSRLKDVDFTANDLGILTAHLVLASEAAGLSSCILGWRSEAKLRTLLSLPERTKIPVVVALGYAKEGDPIRKKVRKTSDRTLTVVR